ncbi:MAG TPA: hypothetical protein VGN57_12715 [Pirellulaceae bacterium]|jgi:hypothetical protein|nr:hypothetical protein [Pirellulaceae bacterium]
MAAASRIEGSAHFTGTLTANAITLPDGCVDDDAVAVGAQIAASKVFHQPPVSRQLFESSTTVAAKDELLSIIYGATGSIVAFRAACAVAPTDDHTFTVDLQKSTSGGAFASVLVDPIEFTVSDTARVAKSGTVETASLVVGDILKTVVAVTGTTGTQATGLVVTLTHTESPS